MSAPSIVEAGLWTADQAAAFLQVRRREVFRLAKKGMPAIQLSPKQLRFDPQELRRWLDAQRTNR